MNSSETLNNQSTEKKEEFTRAGFLNRIIARTIDFIIVVALYEIIPGIGYFAGLAYLMIVKNLSSEIFPLPLLLSCVEFLALSL
jgi:hypothetical protein